jgi:hypothetical protein
MATLTYHSIEGDDTILEKESKLNKDILHTPKKTIRKAKSACNTPNHAAIVTPSSTFGTPKRKDRPSLLEDSHEVSPIKLTDTDDEESNRETSTKKREEHKLPKEVDAVYKLIARKTGALGGNGYSGAIYGELTMHSMEKVLQVLVHFCELNENSRFIDVGSGLGKPNFHALHSPAVRLSLGIELEEIRWQVINFLSFLNYQIFFEFDQMIIHFISIFYYSITVSNG